MLKRILIVGALGLMSSLIYAQDRSRHRTRRLRLAPPAAAPAGRRPAAGATMTRLAAGGRYPEGFS